MKTIDWKLSGWPRAGAHAAVIVVAGLLPLVVSCSAERREVQSSTRQVRETVTWLRFNGGPGVDRELDVLDGNTVVGYEAMKLRGDDERAFRSFVGRVTILKRFK